MRSFLWAGPEPCADQQLIAFSKCQGRRGRFDRTASPPPPPSSPQYGDRLRIWSVVLKLRRWQAGVGIARICSLRAHAAQTFRREVMFIIWGPAKKQDGWRWIFRVPWRPSPKLGSPPTPRQSLTTLPRYTTLYSLSTGAVSKTSNKIHTPKKLIYQTANGL